MKAYYKEISLNEFIEICNNCTSFSELMKRLGYTNNRGNSFIGLKKFIKENNIDISHFKTHGGGKYIEDNQLFVKDSSYTNMTKMKCRIIKNNLIEYKCSICGISKWNGKDLVLQLDHINGDNRDNRLENLRFLCPNCHSQTETFCKRKSSR